MDTESSEFLEGLPCEIKEYFFRIGTYPLESLFSALPNGKRPRKDTELKTKQNRTKKEHERSELIAQLGGMKPPQVARMLLCKYFKQFPFCTLHKVEQLRKLFFKSRTTWDSIDGKLKVAAHICHHQHKELLYWDMARYAARGVELDIANAIKRDKEIARRLRIKKSPKQVQEWVKKQNLIENKRSDTLETEKFYTNRDGKAYVTFRGLKYGLPDETYDVPDDGCLYISKMSVCRYCWRAAFKPFGEQWAYCHEHKNPKEISRSRIKHAKIIRPTDEWLTSEAFMDIWKDFMPSNIIKVRKVTNGIHEDNYASLHEVWNYGPNIILDQLPNVLLLLKDRVADKRSTKQIVMGLEHLPPNFKETTNEARIRKRYYDDFALDYATYAPHLIWAELWLQYEAERPKRGGVRKRAGRPRQRPLEIPTEI